MKKKIASIDWSGCLYQQVTPNHFSHGNPKVVVMICWGASVLMLREKRVRKLPEAELVWGEHCFAGLVRAYIGNDLCRRRPDVPKVRSRVLCVIEAEVPTFVVVQSLLDKPPLWNPDCLWVTMDEQCLPDLGKATAQSVVESARAFCSMASTEFRVSEGLLRPVDRSEALAA